MFWLVKTARRSGTSPVHSGTAPTSTRQAGLKHGSTGWVPRQCNHSSCQTFWSASCRHSSICWPRQRHSALNKSLYTCPIKEAGSRGVFEEVAGKLMRLVYSSAAHACAVIRLALFGVYLIVWCYCILLLCTAPHGLCSQARTVTPPAQHSTAAL